MRVNGATLYYEDQGSGPETIVFAHGLLWSCRMFDAQIASLKDRYRCIAFDFRGQGRSEVTRGGYDMETLTEDAAALIEGLGVQPCHFAGLSMGGFVGMRLAVRFPELLRSLILLETSADPEPQENAPKYRQLSLAARWLGPRVVVNQVMPVMFGRTFLEEPTREEERRLWRERLAANHRVGVSRATIGVLARRSIYDELDRIDLPTLIIVGNEDVATKPDRSRRIREAIKGARLVLIPNAGHSSTIEEPEAVNAAIEQFLSSLKRQESTAVVTE
jgi:pimeloyl-ACP methyl ester carboxylesterase